MPASDQFEVHDPMDDLILGSLKPYQLKNIEEMRAAMVEKERLSR